MSSFAVKLRYFLNEYNLKQNDLAKMTGINKSSISEYLSGNYQPKYKNILKIAQALHISPDVFLEKPQSVKQIPLLGKIAAGMPIFAEENIEGYMPCSHIKADFCLRISGDSMIGARIYDGDIVYIKRQPTVQNGDIAAVLIDDSATLKRVYKMGDTLQLRAENPQYAPLNFTIDNCDNIRILGKAVALYTKL